jgi:hypothetical protein
MYIPEAVSASMFKHSKLMCVSAVRPKLCSPAEGVNSRRTYSYAVVSTPFST